MIHPKSALIERSKQLGFNKPQFDTKRTGPQHEPTFISDALLNGEVYGTGQGSTKRDAERHASEEALVVLEQNAQTPDTTNKNNQPSKNRSNGRSSNHTRKNGLASNGIAPQETITQETTPQETITQETTPQETTPQETTPQEIATRDPIEQDTLGQAIVNQAAVSYIDSNAQAVEDLFEGPWPLVPDVLATSLHIANSRVNPGAQGADAIREVHALAVELYKASLQSLGEVVEIDE
jgi:ribonuclease-3